MEEFLFSTGGVLAVLLWVAVAYRLVIAWRRRPSLESGAGRQAFLLWGAFACVAAAATLYSPAVQAVLRQRFGDGVGTMSLAVCGTVGYLCGVHAAYDFAPPTRPRWNWPLWLGAATIGVITLVDAAAASGRLMPASPVGRRQSAEALFDMLLLLLAVRVGLPATAWALRQERHRPMRARFLAMLAMHGTTAVWMLVGILENLIAALGGRDLRATPVYAVLSVAGGTFFVLAFLAPASHFVHLVRAADHMKDLASFAILRAVEWRAAQWMGREARRLRWVEALRSPGDAVYLSLIATLDARKVLKGHAHPQAQWLGRQLDAAACPEMEYAATVRAARRVGQAMAWRLLTGVGAPDRVRGAPDESEGEA